MTSAALTSALFNGRYLTRPPTGVDRFAIELVGALTRRHAGTAIDIAVPTRTSPLPAGTRAVGRRSGHAWEQLDLPSAAGDVALINLCNTAPLLRSRQLVVIHDLGTVANAGNYNRAFRAWYRLMHSQIMKRARVVATVSRFSADELTRHYGRRARGLEVISEGGEHILREPADNAVVERLKLQGRKYVLAVGSLSPNKNFQSVVKAVQLIGDPELLVVAVGGNNAAIYSGATGLADAQANLVMTGYVSDAELRALYENAFCFAFPSFYEGFGLPPLEAMWCGCPVIVSNRASLPEVCGDAAMYCQAEDPATLAKALRSLLDSSSLRNELIEAGRARAARFNWDSAALNFEQVLHANFT